jgi:predicted DNA-binding protein (MmcQ/YjbR family)
MRIDIETIRHYCISKPGASESLPFDMDTLVFKVGNKMFGAIDLTHGQSINLKCDPELAIELRERHEEVQPGYHMNKKHWNTVELHGRLTLKEVQEMIDHSYELVFNALPKAERMAIQNQGK